LKYYEIYDEVFSSLVERSSPPFASNPLLVEFINDFVSRYDLTKEELSALEVGCGAGSQLFSAANYKGKILGIDVSKVAINLANSQFQNSRIEFKQMDICDFSENSRYHLVIDAHAIHCLALIEDQKMALTNIFNLLKDNGVLIIETMVAHKRMAFDDDYLFLDDQALLLKKDSTPLQGSRVIAGEEYLPVRRVPTAFAFETLLLDIGFTIEFFVISTGIKVIPNAWRTEPLPFDPDLLRVVCRKGVI
jgi:SAM-dependent methyltransferase